MTPLRTLTLIALLGIACNAPSATSDKPPRPNRAEIESAVKLLTDGELVRRIDPPAHTVYMDPLAWRVANVEQKTRTALILAFYCSQNGGSPDLIYVTIKDWMSGRQLATFSETAGLQVE